MDRTQLFTDIESLRRQAKRRVPKAIFDYVDGGSYTEHTLTYNRSALQKIAIKQQVMRAIDNRTSKTTILGGPTKLPLILAPVGLTGFVHPNGEVCSLKAAVNAGIPYTLSTASIGAAEDLSDAVKEPFWFQIYVMKDREFTKFLLKRAKDAGCKTLIITVDLVVNAQRHRDIRNGLSIPFRVTPTTALDAITKPGWFLRMRKSKRRTFGNFEGYHQDASNALSMARWVANQYTTDLTPDTIGWIRDNWDGPIIIKGVMTPEDALRAADFGAKAIIVSNHGGRQLDGGLSPVDVLPSIAQAVRGKVEIYADSGIRTGADIFRLIALGADACLIGRAYIYGLGAAGQNGVSRAIEILSSELDVVMALTGCRSIKDITPELLHAHSTSIDQALS